MAGDWIKIEHVTPDKPEVHRIAESLNIDPDAVVGKLLRLWIWADQQVDSCNAASVTLSLLDRITFVSGFAKAMQSVGWLVITDGVVAFPNFERHNGNTAKSRAKGSERVKRFRNGGSVTEALPEKRREEKNKDSRESQPEQPSQSDSQPKPQNQQTPFNPVGAMVSHAGRGRETFAEFWALYPNKQRQLPAEGAWNSLVMATGMDDALFATIMNAIRAWLPEWSAIGVRKVPLAVNWINEKRWTEAPPEATGPPTPIKPKEETIEERMRRIHEANKAKQT